MSSPIITISPAFIKEHLDQFLAIDRCTLGELWQSQHFEMDMPAKWEISSALLQSGIIIGFLIASQKREGFHIHRLVIRKGFDGKGYGKLLTEKLIQRAKGQGIKFISLKVHQENTRAIDFYLKMNFLNLGKAGDNINMKLSLYNIK